MTPPDYRILVTASRTWTDTTVMNEQLQAAFQEARRQGRRPVVVHGDASGGDKMADTLARLAGEKRDPHPVLPGDWERFGKTAGFRRNAVMVKAGADVCLAFIDPCTDLKCTRRRPHGSHGATHCADLAEQAGIRVRRFR